MRSILDTGYDCKYLTTDSVSIQRTVIITDNSLELDDTKTTARQRGLPLPENTHRISGGQEQIAAWLNTSFPTVPITYDTPLN